MKTWHEKLHCGKVPHTKQIEKSFAGIPAGAQMYISTPLEIDAYLKRIPRGMVVTPKQMRTDLAAANKADHTCPVSTGIFLRIASEAAFEVHRQGEVISAITPFWRVVEPDSDLAKKLACGKAFIEEQRAAEAA